MALKALETPSIISGALSAGDQKVLAALSVRYHQDPIDPIDCVLFRDAAEAQHWVQLRHTGANEGVGLVEWEETDIRRGTVEGLKLRTSCIQRTYNSMSAGGR